VDTIRQGDVLLVRVGSIPKDAVLEKPTSNKLILAHGEMTGHHHRFEFLDISYNVKLYSKGGARYLEVLSPVALLHEEHAPVTVSKGKWMLPRQVEYTPAELRNVAD